MCFTRRKKKIKKIYPIKNYNYNIKSTGINISEEIITCFNCKQTFSLGSNKIKIHCAGCNEFFHCGIAGKCRGDKCNLKTMRNNVHRLSWCIKCVPNIDGNQEKFDGIGTCICKNCLS